jgi:hypothetical protein
MNLFYEDNINYIESNESDTESLIDDINDIDFIDNINNFNIIDDNFFIINIKDYKKVSSRTKNKIIKNDKTKDEIIIQNNKKKIIQNNKKKVISKLRHNRSKFI